LDLFSGSGALSKIALLNGTQKAECADIFTKAIAKNLVEFKNRIKVIEGDIFKMNFKEFYDLVLADTPSTLLIDFTKRVLPQLKTNLVIMYYGGKGNIERDKKIEVLCRK
jgi:16S rRNA G966 N2-methylase RsmD